MLQRPNGYLFICSTSTSTCLILLISYNLIHNRGVGQGSFFFYWNLAVNPTKMSNDTTYMTSMSKENFGRTCGGFSALNIQTKVPDGEAYQSAMPNNASIASFDMHGGSYSNIILYNGVTRLSDNHMITPLKLHSDNSLKYVFRTVFVGDHAHSKSENSCQAQIESEM